MRPLFVLAFIAGLPAVAPRPASAQYYEVRPRYEPGAETYWRYIANGHQIVRNPATLAGAVTKTEILCGFRLRVLDGQEPDQHPLELTFLSFLHRYIGPTRAEFDSTQPEACASPEHVRVAQALLGKPFQVVLNDAGDVTAVKGLEAFVSESLKDVDPVIYSMYADLVSLQTLGHMLMMQYFRNAPPEVLRGGGWQAQIEDTQGGGSITLTRELNLTLDQTAMVKGRSVARVQFEGPIRQVGAQRQTHPEAPRVGDVEGKEAGTLYVDVFNGQLLSGTVRQVTSADLALHTDGEMLERRIDQQMVRQLELVEDEASLDWRPPRSAATTQPAATQPADSQPALHVETTTTAPQ